MPDIEKVVPGYARGDDYFVSGYSTPGLLVNGGRLLFIQGIAGWDAQLNMVTGAFGDEVRRCFENLTAVLAEAGGTLANVVQMTYYFSAEADMGEFLSIRKEYFPEGIPPSTGLPAMLDGARVEIQCIGVVD